MRAVFAARCDRAACGHAAAAPPSIAMNARRLMGNPSGNRETQCATERAALSLWES
jgi:hypothetical protein